MRTNIMINGITRSQSEWAKMLGITREAFACRLASCNPDLLRPKRTGYDSRYKKRFGCTLNGLAKGFGVSIARVRRAIMTLDSQPDYRKLLIYLLEKGEWE